MSTERWGCFFFFVLFYNGECCFLFPEDRFARREREEKREGSVFCECGVFSGVVIPKSKQSMSSSTATTSSSSSSSSTRGRLALGTFLVVVPSLLMFGFWWITSGEGDGSGIFGVYSSSLQQQRSYNKNDLPRQEQHSFKSSVEYDMYEHRRLKNWVPNSEDHDRIEASQSNSTDYCWRAPRLVIFSQQRSGTHWLQQLLNSHPDVDVAPELAKHLGNEEKCIAADEERLISSVEKRRSGFILQFNTLMHRAPLLLHKLKDRFTIVHFVRTNSLDMILSHEIDRQTGVIHCHLGENCTIQQSTVKLNTTQLLFKIGALLLLCFLFRVTELPSYPMV